MQPTDSKVQISTSDLQEARAPLASLISKSEKAQLKLKSGSWQHNMLRDNLRALHIAAALLQQDRNSTADFTASDLEESLATLARIIEKVEVTEGKFTPGTSQHTLQRNRLMALRVAESLLKAEFEKHSA
ncbi:hypothetical protein [Anatilimnocola floriformis]|uniref:hypothetical protein n=1 Tax=Anatilimnocola floriformis TaxID=2948575 RepID=UPI0020C50D47|nr:hypothetical protein [Anatilimnocola floriformis]